jgi:UDP-GlcNAc:undecaprenyl-phosphate GlcNAc-1-phosphate transferase
MSAIVAILVTLAAWAGALQPGGAVSDPEALRAQIQALEARIQELQGSGVPAGAAALPGLVDTVQSPRVPLDIPRVADPAADADASAAQDADLLAEASGRLEVFHGYMGVLVLAFLVTLLLTPVMRRLAVANGVLDRPLDPRKVHRAPVPYLGGVAVFLGIFAGIAFSYLAAAYPALIGFHSSTHLDAGLRHHMLPLSIPMGIFIIMLVGLLDDVTGISPRIKVAGQLIAAAALAYEDVGVKVAEGVLKPTLGVLLANQDLTWDIDLGTTLPLLGSQVRLDVIYWCGTAVIAIFVLGACNASNLIDGLDGLCSGVTAVANVGLLIVALGLAIADDGPRDAQRIVLCMSVLGACLGFLPHNFNPASIFLGDAGSLMLGFCTIVVVLTLGDTGRTDLVLAGVIIYAIPIIDTVLAIVRRKLAGKAISDPDSNHLHHMLKRSLGVKGAVLTLYGFGAVFAGLGVWMASGRARVTYTLAIILASYIAVTAIKIARRAQIEAHVLEIDQRRAERARAEAARRETTRRRGRVKAESKATK